MSVGIGVDTGEFAVESIRRWWKTMGRARYGSSVGEIYLTADCGGSSAHRAGLWKLELQGLADELGVPNCAHPAGEVRRR